MDFPLAVKLLDKFISLLNAFCCFNKQSICPTPFYLVLVFAKSGQAAFK